MKKDYVFITNGNKPSNETYASREDITLSNFVIPPIETALSLDYECYVSLNRKYATEIKCKYPVHSLQHSNRGPSW